MPEEANRTASTKVFSSTLESVLKAVAPGAYNQIKTTVAALGGVTIVKGTAPKPAGWKT